MTARGTPKQVGDLLAHARWVKRIAADLVDGDLAEDVAQDVWLTSIRRPPAHGSALRAWLRTVVTNLVRSGYRSDRRRQARETALSLAAEGVSSDTPEELTIRTQLQRRLAEQILTLREPYRQAVVHRYVDDLSAAQIARILQVPAGTVRRRIKVGLDCLREALRDELHERERWARLVVPLAPAHLRLVPADGQRLPGRPGGLTLAAGTRSGQALLVGALLVLPLLMVAVLRGATPAEPARALRSEPASGVLRAPVFLPATLLDGETSSQRDERVRAPKGALEGDPSTAVTGRVLDTHGHGLSAATVSAWSPHRRDQPARQVRADERGRYEIALPAGRYVLKATSPGYARGLSWVDLRGARQVDLRLHLRAQLAGRVVERATGQPLPGGLVTASCRQVSGLTAQVDGAGAFSLTVDAGGYRVSARRGGLYGVSEPVQARPGESATVLIALAPTAAIQGRVRGEAATDGSGLGGVKVTVRAVSDLPVCRGFQATTTTAPDGGYRLEGLPPCGLAIEFVAPRHIRRSVPVADWAAGADRRVDTWLAPASVLTGQVRDVGGAPVAGARIEVGARAQAVETPATDDTRPGTAPRRRLTSDEAGRFEVDHLPAGDTWIVVQHQRGVASIGPVHLGRGETRPVSIELGPPAWISGRVTYPDGASVRDFTVQAIATRDTETFGSPSVAVSGEDGRFTIGPLVAGQVSLGPMRTWHMVTRGPTSGLRPLMLTLAEGELRTGVQLTVVRPEGGVEGTVTDGAGRAVEGATVDLFLRNAETGAHDFEVRVFSDAAGRFEVSDLPAGTRALAVDHPLHGRVWRRGVRPGAPPLGIRLKPARASLRH